MDSTKKTHQGSCHCGKVRFGVVGDSVQASRCNCSVCTKLSWTGWLAKPEAFEVLAGEESLGSYAPGPNGTRYFCKHCGTMCFGRGELAEVGGAYVSINANALDTLDPHLLPLVYWDGRHDNWHAGPRNEPWPIFP